jgi:hypothetical protein
MQLVLIITGDSHGEERCSGAIAVRWKDSANCNLVMVVVELSRRRGKMEEEGQMTGLIWVRLT